MKHSAPKKILIILLAVLVLLSAGMGIFAAGGYRAEAEAAALLETPGITRENSRIILSPDTPNGTGILFYPGARVDPAAYLPLLNRLREEGITVVIAQMPLNLAVLKPNAADDIFDDYPQVDTWYISGHSMGGAMASSYAAKHPDRVAGLILLAAYIYGDYPQEKALTIYGSLNTTVADKIHYTDNIVVIPGGNHAQFGNYGLQRGDAIAQISPQEQQSAACDAILAFVQRS